MNFKRLILAFLILCAVVAGSAQATVGLGYTNTASNSGGSTSQTTTGGTTQATGSTFFVVVNTRITSVVPTVSDSKGNTYGTPVLSLNFGFGLSWLYVFECINGVGGSGHTATVNFVGATAAGIEVGFAEFTGVGAGTSDSTPVGNSTGTLVATWTAPSITTTVSNELVVDVLGTFGGGLGTVTDSGTGFAVALFDSTTLGIALSWATPASTGAAADTFNWASANYPGALSVSIKPFAPVVINGAVLSNGHPVKSGSSVLYK